MTADKTAPLPDFTKPHPGWKKYEVNGHTLYAPRGISYHRPSKLWRTTFRYVSHYSPTLTGAYLDLVERKRAAGPEKWVPRAPLRKRIDTGMAGMRIHIGCTKGRYYVSVVVAQTLSTGNCAPRIGHINAEELSQQWLDNRLCEAAAVRWEYIRQRQTQKPLRPVLLPDVPRDTIPTQPVRRVLVQEVFDVIADKQAS